MKVPHVKALVGLSAVILGGFVVATSFAIGSGQAAAPQARISVALSSSGMVRVPADSPAQLIQDKIKQVCRSADKNQDGYISKTEYKALKNDAGVGFKAADLGHKGRLSMMECAMALSG